MPIVLISESLLHRSTIADGRILRDRVLCGFGVRLNARKRTFLIATSVAGRQFRMMLGYWPLMSVEDARTKALEVLRECRAGRTPSKQVTQDLPTVRDALVAYCDAKSIKASSQKRYDSLMRTHFGDWLDRSVADFGGQAFAEHCHAFATSKGAALVEVGRGVIGALIKYINAVLREANAEWAHACFDALLREPDRDGVLQVREGLSFNPLATSLAGRLFALRFQATPRDIEPVLMVAARGIHEVAHGLGSAINAVMEVDPRVVKSLVRCALYGCTSSRRHWNIKPEKEAELKAKQDKLAKHAVDAELQWLAGAGTEPGWPMPPRREPRSRSGIHIPKLPAVDEKIITMEKALSSRRDGEPEIPLDLFHDDIDPPWFSSQAAALWLRQLNGTPVEQLPWLAEMVETYIPWTLVANGAEMGQGEEASDTPREWNQVFFDVLARTLPPEDLPKALSWIGFLFKLDDQNFFDLTAILTGAMDENYFGPACRPSAAVAVGIREALANHLITTWGWRRAQGKKDSFSEFHLGQAVAGMFFNTSGFGTMPSQCYLRAQHVNRLGDFLPVLHKLVAAGPSFKVADVLLNLLAVSPRTEHLPLLAASCRRWLEAFAGFPVFWVDFGMGDRWCKVVQAAIGSDGTPLDPSVVADLTHQVAELVALGVSEALSLETELAGR